MSKFNLFLTLFLCICFQTIFAQLSVETNIPSARYDVGENIQFNINSSDSGLASYIIKYDNYASPIQTGTLNLIAGQTASIEYTHNEVGHVQLLVTLADQSATSGASVGCFDIQPLETAPEDFKDFWDTQIALLENIPLDPQISLHASTQYSTTYKINLAHIDNRRVYGYISIPVGDGPFPAILTMPPYGITGSTVQPETVFAEHSNAISIAISIHNADVDENDPNAYTPDDYWEREGNYYRFGLLGGVRAIDYIHSRNDFDQTNLAVYGVSQGGGLSILMAGIDDRIDICMNSTAILCENAGLYYEQAGGFPNYINKSRNEDGSATHEAATLSATKYYDAVHAAAHFDGPVLMNISYLDEITPPAPNFAAYNQFKGSNKVLTHATKFGHHNPEEFWSDRIATLKRFWPEATANAPWPWVSSSTGYFVEAGPNINIAEGTSATLSGSVEINGTNNTSLPVQWTKIEGPGNVTFSNSNNRNTTAIFSTNGTYLLKFLAQDDISHVADNIFYTAEDYVQIIVGSGEPTIFDQTISFTELENKLVTDNAFNIFAAASSGLDVEFSIVSGPATIIGNEITLTGQTGTVVVEASQAGNNQYHPAPSITQTFEVIDESLAGPCTSLENVALNKPATQSGTQVGASADRANDGNTDGNFWGTNSVTYTNWVSNSWWEVDLGSIHQIEEINIWNRTDCCTTDLANFHILVSETPFTSTNLNETINQQGVSGFFINPIAGTPTTELINVTGQFVRIQLQGTAALALAEVEIMGCIDGTNNCNMIGQICDDFDDCTTNDVYDTNCICIGTFMDADNDSVCDAEDICFGGDDLLDNDGNGIPDFCDEPACTVGAICNDGDPCTSYDAYDQNCNCIGIYQDSDNDGICDANDFDPPTPEERTVQICATPLSPSGMQFEWEAETTAQQYYVHKKTLDAISWGDPIATLPGTATSFIDNNINTGEAFEYAFFKQPFVIVRDTFCIPSNTELAFNISDVHGIGLCCSFGEGYYEILSCGNLVGYGDDFGFEDYQSFTVCDNGNGCEEVIVNIKPSMWPDATSWSLTDIQTGNIVASGGLTTPIAVRSEFGYVYAGNEAPAIEDRGTILLLIDDSYVPALNAEIEQLKNDFILDGWKVQQKLIHSNENVVAVKTQVQQVYNSVNDLTALFLLGNIPVPYSGNIYPDTHSEHKGAWPADLYYGDMDGTWTDETVNTTTAFFNENHNVPGDGKFDQSIIPSTIELQVGRVDLSRMFLFNDSEIELTRNYLNKNHAFKTGQVNTVRRGLIDDNFNRQFAACAANGYRNFSIMFGWENIDEVDYRTTLQNQSYLWSYGCGSGSNIDVAGVTSTANFANDNLQTIFTMLFGSQFGDWNHENNVLRAAIASGQTLTNVWAGNPDWFFHHMPLGHNIGYSTIKTQNSDNGVYLPGKQNIHVALMGDPTLRMHPVVPPTALSINNINEGIELDWTAPVNETIAGYNVYRSNTIDGNFSKINNNLITNNNFTDIHPMDGYNVYIVKTVKLESSCSGTYFNTSLGILDSLSFNSNCIVGNSCDDLDLCTINDVYDANCNCVGTFEDNDNDSVCDAEDVCPNGDDTLDIDEDGIPDFCDDSNCIVGQTCDDANPCTSNDVYDANCGCIGILEDADNDGICDEEDCAPTDPTLPATPNSTCNDFDATTTNDVIQADGCTCAGASLTECNITLTSSNGTISISGMAGIDINAKVFTTSWSEVWGCNPWYGTACNSTEIISGLNVGDTYYVSVQSSLCNFFQTIEVVGGGCPDADSDTICDANDICPGGDDLVDTDGDGTPDFCNDTEDYCSSYGNSTAYEYIEKVVIGDFTNTSGNNNGYADFTAISNEVIPGSPITIKLTPGFTGSIHFVYWSVWIDFNQDGDFLDEGEQVYQKRSKFTAQKSLIFPTTALAGTTLMRVSMKADNYPEPCEIFSYGEVEDYTINIVPANVPFIQQKIKEESSFSFDMRPNPVDDHLIIELDQKITKANGGQYFIYNAQGILKQNGGLDDFIESKRFTIQTSELEDGYYVIVIEKNGITKGEPFIKMAR